MRLKKIKLAGFKSFVDPTTLELPSSLVAVVGPNGCGKSNVIDAVRWVMGESSAKNLRGESMSDVIFNGSTTRKPVAQASIELVFDNSDGSLGGEYANYAEISIRRQAGRDSQSDYYLNGTKCRRRDITDIFLGTGLGPRSYAIIEQGMISRVIEAKPEDLRSFFEEAAGISLYRRRRHETETRMRHTRENLARLDDVRQELEKQLERLKRQSENAERYQILKQEHDTLEAELTALRWRVFKTQQDERRSQTLMLSKQFEEKMAGKTSIDHELETTRDQHAEKTEAYDEIHRQYYELGTQVARSEQTLEHHREKQVQMERDLLESKQDIARIFDQTTHDKGTLSTLKTEWETLSPEFSTSEERLESSRRVLEEAQSAHRTFQENFDQFLAQSSIPQQTAEVEKARIEQLDRQTREASAQLGRLEQELSILNIDTLTQGLEALETELLTQEQALKTHQANQNGTLEQLQALRARIQTITQSLDNAKRGRQATQGRLASLEALQQAALGKSGGAVKEWLKLAGYEDCARLGECLQVTPGYERAVETALGSALEAVCVNDINAASQSLSQFLKGSITLIQTDASASSNSAPINSSSNMPSGTRLIEKVSMRTLGVDIHSAVEALLAGIWVVDDLPTAMMQRHHLKLGESIITRDGIWLSTQWIRVHHDAQGQGLLERDVEIQSLSKELETLTQEIQHLEAESESVSKERSALETQREAAHQSSQEASRKLQDLASRTSAARTRLEQSRTRFARIQDEMANHKQRLTQSQEESGLARVSLANALNSMEENSKRKQALVEERDNLKQILRQAEAEMQISREANHKLALRREHLKAQIAGLEQGISRLTEQHTAMEERIQSLQSALVEHQAPYASMRQSLESMLKDRLEMEARVQKARAEVESLDQTLQLLEKRRQNYEQEAEFVREALDEARMEQQALEIRRQGVEERLEALGKTADQIFETMPAEAMEEPWSERLEQVSNKITRLGAINLAAIEEYQSESERKSYLDAQHLDLSSALETLENAIKKIDRETRARFKETFDKVDSEFKVLFPKLFGGGQACLELVGEDLLEAGVTVTARPPGKRNSSIHLLSGGEKALTAVALVFSIFQLNPAPFCMLDEVDAPLDDANVGRFCELVKHMSQSVQFIYITHNKVSMEMSNHLIGVTMKEPGVSRLVTVDVSQAYEMATA